MTIHMRSQQYLDEYEQRLRRPWRFYLSVAPMGFALFMFGLSFSNMLQLGWTLGAVSVVAIAVLMTCLWSLSIARIVRSEGKLGVTTGRLAETVRQGEELKQSLRGRL